MVAALDVGTRLQSKRLSDECEEEAKKAKSAKKAKRPPFLLFLHSLPFLLPARLLYET